jgi:hypothetical protein
MGKRDLLGKAVSVLGVKGRISVRQSARKFVVIGSGRQMVRSKNRSAVDILRAANARFSDAALRRLMTAIRNDKPLVPLDAEGWDVGAMLVTASALVARATALAQEKAIAEKVPRAKRRTTRNRKAKR